MPPPPSTTLSRHVLFYLRRAPRERTLSQAASVKGEGWTPFNYVVITLDGGGGGSLPPGVYCSELDGPAIVMAINPAENHTWPIQLPYFNTGRA